jgi:hypothetical protein
MLINLMVETIIEDYDTWIKEGFGKDAERRAKMCNESKTKVAKISNTEAVILLFDVDIDKLREHMHDPVMKILESKFKAKHRVNTFSPID